jgi:outer membrane protein assembly factor BamD (BamD/ComL family)
MDAGPNMKKRKRIWTLSIILAILLVCLWLPVGSTAAVSELPAGSDLQKKAQQAFVEGRYADAAAINLKIAGNHRSGSSSSRRYAVLMLGRLYGNNLVDLAKAITWHRTYLNEYAGPREVPYYRQKLALFEQLIPHEKAFAAYQEIRHANAGDQLAVEKYEALLADHPGFPLKAKVLKELGYAYGRLDKSYRSFRSFQDLSQIGGEEFSAEEQMAYGKVRRNLTLAVIAWTVVILLWAAALMMNPWVRMTRASVRTFMIGALFWLLLAAIRLPSYYAIAGSTEDNPFPHAAVYIAAALNVAVLFWLLLLTRGKFWQDRPKALLWISPLLALLMSVSVFYLFLFYQPRGSETVDAFAAQYRRWADAGGNPGGGGAQPVSRQDGIEGRH